MNAAAQKTVIRHLVLWLTTDCNLSCSYCYRGQPRKHLAMSRQTAMSALELAADSGQSFHVQMAGGEPTLEPDLVEFIVRTVREKKLPATLAIQTNAVALTPELAALLRRYEIGVGISLDGPPKIQDFLRGKAAATLRGLDVLERAGVDFKVTAVVSAACLRHLFRLALLLSCYERVRGLGLDLLVQRGRAAKGVPAMADTESLGIAMKDLALAIAWINQRRRQPLVLRELERIKENSGVFCPAAAGASLAVHPDGRLYPCGQTMGDDELALGNLDQPDFANINRLSGFVLGSAQCGGCPLEGRCPGECPSRLKYNGSQGRELGCAMLRGLVSGLEANNSNRHIQLDCDHEAA